MIVIVAGLPGTGKSTLARALAERLDGAVLDKDVIRAALFRPALIEYSRTQDDFCMEIMLQAAEYLLARDAVRYVFLDGRTFSRGYQRARVIDFCARIGAAWAMIECVCAQQTALVRLAAQRHVHPAANRTEELYQQVRAAWEPIDCARLVVDTEAGLRACLDAAVAHLAANPS